MSNPAATARQHSEVRQGNFPALRIRPRRSLDILCADLLLSLALPALASKPDSVPDWVRAAAAQTLPHYPAETNAVVLLEDTTYTVAPDGRAVEHVRHVVKILRPQGRGEATVHVGYDNDTKILSLHVWSIGPDGHEYAMKDKDYSDVGIDGGYIAFADDKFRVAHAPGGDPGGVIAYEYEQRSRPFVTEKTWFFQEEVPHLSQSFTLELPPGYTYGTVWAHHPAVQAADLEHQRWHWQMDDTAGIDLDRVPMSPSPDSLEGRMTVHYAGPNLGASTEGTWKSIGEWYAQLSKDRLTATPEIAAKANELAAGKTDFYDKTEAIAEFVQKQVRYVAIEVGIGGYQPHPAADIFRNPYGDCKDTATLVSAMLSAVAVHSALMMVDSQRGVVDPDAPSLVGNHMLARAAGMKAYVMAVASRDRRFFQPNYLSFSQLDDLIAIVNVDGKEQFFDPGQRDCPYGHLAWKHTMAQGLRQVDGGTAIGATPGEPYTASRTQRVANLTMDEHGEVTGTVKMTWNGAPALRWRQASLRGDLTSLNRDLRVAVEHLMPGGMGVKVAGIEHLDDYEQPLTVNYEVKGGIASSTGKRLLLPGDIFEANSRPTFPHDKRETAVYFDYPHAVQDAVRINFPASLAVEALPASEKLPFQKFAAYGLTTESTATSFTVRREFDLGNIIYTTAEYPDLRAFYAKFETKDQESAVLKAAAAASGN